jgi:hypothetical protein
MRKGFFASVAALATSAGVALGQGFPSAPPGYPAAGAPDWQSAGGGAPAVGNPADLPGGPTGNPAGAMNLPPAGEMPAYGQVDGPNSGHPMNPGAEPKHGMFVGQVHKAAGGPDKFYFDIEAMTWAIRSLPLPYPLITTGTPTSAGRVGMDGTTNIIADHLDYGNTLAAGRLTFGGWDCSRTWGWEASGFLTEEKSETNTFAVGINDRLVLARPAIDAITGQATSLLVAFPGQFGGNATVDARIHFGGAELNLVRSLVYCDMFKLNVLVGGRYINLEEALTISSTTAFPTADPANPNLSTIVDQFLTRNQFGGGQLGFESEFRRGRIFVDLTGKVAAGNMNERVAINGFTQQTIVVGGSSLTQGGLLALGSNSGVRENNEFAYVPEGTVKFGYQWTQRISSYVGANGLYMSRVVRTGDQIDPVVNPVFVPVSNQFGGAFGPARPLPTNNQADFWAIGVTFGLSIRY